MGDEISTSPTIRVYGFPSDNVPEGEASAFAPYFHVKRSGAEVDCDQVCNPSSEAYDPSQCKEVWPSAMEVDQFLYYKPRPIDPVLFGGHMMMDHGSMDGMDHGSMDGMNPNDSGTKQGHHGHG